MLGIGEVLFTTLGGVSEASQSREGRRVGVEWERALHSLADSTFLSSCAVTKPDADHK